MCSATIANVIQTLKPYIARLIADVRTLDRWIAAIESAVANASTMASTHFNRNVP
jgi:hypothetical protein